jgi:hypothetical protein
MNLPVRCPESIINIGCGVANLRCGGPKQVQLRLKGQLTRFFASGFFMNHLRLKIALGSFRIFPEIRRDICRSWCTISINDTGGAPWAANISANFREKKIETALIGYSEAWVKLIHEKTWRRKSRGTVPLIRDRVRRSYLGCSVATLGWGVFNLWCLQ